MPECSETERELLDRMARRLLQDERIMEQCAAARLAIAERGKIDRGALLAIRTALQAQIGTLRETETAALATLERLDEVLAELR